MVLGTYVGADGINEECAIFEGTAMTGPLGIYSATLEGGGISRKPKVVTGPLIVAGTLAEVLTECFDK